MFQPILFDFRRFINVLMPAINTYTKYSLIYQNKKINVNCCYLTDNLILFGLAACGKFYHFFCVGFHEYHHSEFDGETFDFDSPENYECQGCIEEN